MNDADFKEYKKEFIEARLQIERELRGIDRAEDVCQGCAGSGIKCYATTGTWRSGAGGSTPTCAVCDKCWGSGHKNKPWPSHRLLETSSAARRAGAEAMRERAAKVADDPKHGVSAWRARENIAAAIRALEIEG